MKKDKKVPLIVSFICFTIIFSSVIYLNRTINYIPLFYLIIFLTGNFWFSFYLWYSLKTNKSSIKQLLKSKSKKNNKRKIVFIIIVISIIIGSIKIMKSAIDLIIGPQELIINNVELRNRTSRFPVTNGYLYGTKNNGEKIIVNITPAILNIDNNYEYINNNKSIKIKYYKYTKYIYKIEK